MSSAFSLLATSSSAPFLLPLPAAEWHSTHFCDEKRAFPCCTLSSARAIVAMSRTATPNVTPTTRFMIPSSDCNQCRFGNFHVDWNSLTDALGDDAEILEVVREP